jgi:RNA polymerase sigma-70 factor (ECF subfamily)
VDAQLLADLVARAEAAGHAFDRSSFVASIERHAEASGDPVDYLKTARAEDLALAHACARGDQAALATFEKLYFGEIDRALLKVKKGSVDRDDFAQRIRERLFVATDGKSPRIESYAGQGDLRTWFRVAMTRALINEATRPNRDDPTEDEELAAMPAQNADPELELLRRKYTEEFKASFARALSSMEARDKAILGYVFVQKLGIDALAEVYDIHRATAARWVQRAREGLVAGVRADLEANLRVQKSELESILRLVDGEVDLSVRRLL